MLHSHARWKDDWLVTWQHCRISGRATAHDESSWQKQRKDKYSYRCMKRRTRFLGIMAVTLPFKCLLVFQNTEARLLDMKMILKENSPPCSIHNKCNKPGLIWFLQGVLMPGGGGTRPQKGRVGSPGCREREIYLYHFVKRGGHTCPQLYCSSNHHRIGLQ